MEELFEDQNQFGFQPMAQLKEYGQPWELININMKKVLSLASTPARQDSLIINNKSSKNIHKLTLKKMDQYPHRGKQNARLGQRKNQLKILSAISEQYEQPGCDPLAKQQRRLNPLMCRDNENFMKNDSSEVKVDYSSKNKKQQNPNITQAEQNQFLQSMSFKDRANVSNIGNIPGNQPDNKRDKKMIKNLQSNLIKEITREQIISKRQAQIIKKSHEHPWKAIRLDMRRALSQKHDDDSCSRSVCHVKKERSNSKIHRKLPILEPNKQMLPRRKISCMGGTYSDDVILIISNSLGKGGRMKRLKLTCGKGVQMERYSTNGLNHKHKLLLSPMKKAYKQKCFQ